MKTRTKALLIVLCAALLVVATALTTIAWLTSTPDQVTNTFTFSDDNNVHITLDEAKVDAYGNCEYVEVEGGDKKLADRVRANTYKLIPGHSYVKDPTIHVANNSIDCYLFVTVDNDIADIEAEGNTTIAAQMAAKGWVSVDGAKDNVYVYVGTAAGTTAPLKVTAGADVPVFDSFKIKGDGITATILAKYDEKTVVVNAYAVQADGFGDKTAIQMIDAAFPTLKAPDEATATEPTGEVTK